MSLVKVVNVSASIIHISNIDSVIQSKGHLIMPETEARSNSEIMGVVAANMIEIVPMENPVDEAVDKEENLTAKDTEEEVGKEDEDVSNKDPVDTNSDKDEAEVDIEEMESKQGIILCEDDKVKNREDNKASVKFANEVVKVDPFKSQVGKEDSEPVEEVDGIKIINADKEVTVNVDGIDLVLDGDEEEYGDQFIEHDESKYHAEFTDEK